jgi:hypothetical protein
MARRDGIFPRGCGKIKSWWLDTIINGVRYQKRLGRGITRTVALELAAIERAKILRGEAGIGKKSKKDLTFEEAKRNSSTGSKRTRSRTRCEVTPPASTISAKSSTVNASVRSRRGVWKRTRNDEGRAGN